MKYFVFSDVHGSLVGFALAKKAWEAERADCLLLLGDILHGGYEGTEEECAKAFREVSVPILAVRGNCDDISDENLLGFSLPENRGLTIFGHCAHLAHRPMLFSFPPHDLVITGHTHRKTLYSDRGVIYLNPGSISYPRDAVASYAIIDEAGIFLKSADSHEILEKLSF